MGRRFRDDEGIGLEIRGGSLVVIFRPMDEDSQQALADDRMKRWSYEDGVSARLSGGNHYHELEIPLALLEGLPDNTDTWGDPAIFRRTS